MTFTITDRNVILEQLHADKKHETHDMILGDLHAYEQDEPIERAFKQVGLVIQVDYDEMETLLLPLLRVLSSRAHFVMKVELGRDLPIDTVNMLSRVKAYAEHAVLETGKGSDIRISLAFYNKHFGRIYDDDLFPKLLFS